MQVDSKNNLILNIKNKTQIYSTEEVRKALEEYEKNKIATSQVSFCANHDRDTQEAINGYYKSYGDFIWGGNPTTNIREGAIKHDKDKVKMELLPPYSLEKIAKVFTFGANKYEDWNYLKGDGLKLSRVYGACLRHLNSWYKAEELDPETRESHLAHAGCCIMMLMELVNAKNNDDRPKHYVKDSEISNLLDVHKMD